MNDLLNDRDRLAQIMEEFNKGYITLNQAFKKAKSEGVGFGGSFAVFVESVKEEGFLGQANDFVNSFRDNSDYVDMGIPQPPLIEKKTVDTQKILIGLGLVAVAVGLYYAFNKGKKQ